MRHLGDRLVAQPGTGLDQSPAQVDVLAGTHGLVEAADITQRRSATNDCGAGHVGNGGVRNHRSFAVTEIQRRAHCLVAGDRIVGVRQADDPRGDQRHGRDRRSDRAELPASRAAGRRRNPGRRRTPSCRRRGRYYGPRPDPCSARAATSRCRSARPAKSSCVIGVDEPSSTTTIRKPRNEVSQPTQAKSVVAHRNYDRDVTVRRTARGPRVGHRRVEQGPGQLGADRVAEL